MDGATVDPAAFRTPQRILLPKLLASRAGWKRKAAERKRQLKAARIRQRDLEVSRDRWRARAAAAEGQVGALRSQLEQAQRDLADARADADALRDTLKKKSPPLR
jgi:chromosome segregation ATPase